MGVTVLHRRECYASDGSDLNAFRTIRDSVISTPGPLGRFLLQGGAGTNIVPELAPFDFEPVIDKAGLSAYYGNDLDARLRGKRISHLILMGVTTQVCVASTLRAAVDHGYFPLLVSVCCAAWDELDHEATLRVVFSENHQFGWVTDSVRLIEACPTSASHLANGSRDCDHGPTSSVADLLQDPRGRPACKLPTL